MLPVLFRLRVPEFLQSYLGEYLSFHSYGLFIALGAVLAYMYVKERSKKVLGLPQERISGLFVLIVVVAYIGGRIGFFFEQPEKYFGNPVNMLELSGSGFVLYGSLLAAIPAMIWYFRKYRIPTYPMLDIMAIAGTLVQGFGKVGCFLAGCCHGSECSPGIGIVYNDPLSRAEPLGVPLYPTQLFDAVMLFGIFFFLMWLRDRKRFHGQLFLLYVMLYSIIRAFSEAFRGDEERGYVIDNILSHSQFVSIFVILGCLWFYRYLSPRQRVATQGAGA